MAYDPNNNNNAFADFFGSSQPWYGFTQPEQNAHIPPPTSDDIWGSLGVPTTSNANQSSFNTANNANGDNTAKSPNNANDGFARYFNGATFPGLPFNFGAPDPTSSASPSAFGGQTSAAFNPGIFGPSGDANAAAAFFGGIGATPSEPFQQSRLSRSASGSNISDSAGSPDSERSDSAPAPAQTKKDAVVAPTPGKSTRARKASTAGSGKKSNATAAAAAATAVTGGKNDKDKLGDKRKEPADGRPAAGTVKDRRPSKRTSVSGTSASAQEDDITHTHPNGDDSAEEDDDEEDEGSTGTGKRKTSNRRKEQNRNAQRAFRERKERHMKELEDRVASLESTTKDQATENQNLRDLVERLRRENERLTVYETAFQFSFNREYVQPSAMPISSSFAAGAKNSGVQAAAAAARKNSPTVNRRQSSTSGSSDGASPAAAATTSSNGRATSSPEATTAGSPGSTGTGAGTGAGKGKQYNEYGEKLDNIWGDIRDPSNKSEKNSNLNSPANMLGQRQLPKNGAGKKDTYEVDLNGLCAEMEAKASCQEAARKALEEALIQDQHLAHIFKNTGTR